jgi:CHRD domain
MPKRTGLTVAGLIIGAIAVLAISSYATADSGKGNVSTGPMTGYLEGAPGGPVSSSASGSFEATIDDGANPPTIHYTLSYEGLEDNVTQAHIHFGQRSVNGGISVWLCQGTATGPLGTPNCPGTRSGTITDAIVAADIIGPSGQGIAAGEFDELVAAIRAGRAYANVHSAKFPGGEVRGQINDDNQRDD